METNAYLFSVIKWQEAKQAITPEFLAMMANRCPLTIASFYRNTSDDSYMVDINVAYLLGEDK